MKTVFYLLAGLLLIIGLTFFSQIEETKKSPKIESPDIAKYLTKERYFLISILDKEKKLR